MQLRQRYATQEVLCGPPRGTKRSRNRNSRGGVATATATPSSSGTTKPPHAPPPPNYVRYEKGLNVTYIATGVTSPRNLRSGVNLHSEMPSGVKTKACRKHHHHQQHQQQQRKAKGRANMNVKSTAGGSRHDKARQIGNGTRRERARIASGSVE